MIQTGIYCFTNKINGKQYIGQSINIWDRYKQHQYRYSIIGDSGYNSAIHSAMRKYGWDNFIFEIIEECKIYELDDVEIYYIENLDTLTPNGYNILAGGQLNRPSTRHICPDCGGTKSLNAQRCWGCRIESESQSYIYRVPKDTDWELVYQILDTSFEEVAKKYGYASGNSIKKALKNMGIPHLKKELYDYYHQHYGTHHPAKQKQIERKKEIDEYKAKIAPVAVKQYALNGDYIATYPSINQAARAVGCKSGNISEQIADKRKTAGGYIWKKILGENK